MPDSQNINDIFNNLLKQNFEVKTSKPVKPKLSASQTDSLNKRLKRLAPQFKKAIQ